MPILQSISQPQVKDLDHLQITIYLICPHFRGRSSWAFMKGSAPKFSVRRGGGFDRGTVPFLAPQPLQLPSPNINHGMWWKSSLI